VRQLPKVFHRSHLRHRGHRDEVLGEHHDVAVDQKLLRHEVGVDELGLGGVEQGCHASQNVACWPDPGALFDAVGQIPGPLLLRCHVHGVLLRWGQAHVGPDWRGP